MIRGAATWAAKNVYDDSVKTDRRIYNELAQPTYNEIRKFVVAHGGQTVADKYNQVREQLGNRYESVRKSVSDKYDIAKKRYESVKKTLYESGAWRAAGRVGDATRATEKVVSEAGKISRRPAFFQEYKPTTLLVVFLQKAMAWYVFVLVVVAIGTIALYVTNLIETAQMGIVHLVNTSGWFEAWQKQIRANPQ